jgi:hypothetical protein
MKLIVKIGWYEAGMVEYTLGTISIRKGCSSCHEHNNVVDVVSIRYGENKLSLANLFISGLGLKQSQQNLESHQNKECFI